ncbi:lysine exporter LysO family protein [Scandinavium sp. NPDC088450]|uniref:lysine exporter LysO family protein n=1 Tax=Scandinavium sp. NPDC088450 TaxID=3364514 RepID=UPI00384D19E3
MSIALENLLPILAAFILGYNIRRVLPSLSMPLVDKISTVCLYSLLILMGVTIGQIPDIIKQMNHVGISALSVAFASSFAIAVVLAIFYSGISLTKAESQVGQSSFNIIGYIKDPLLLASLVVFGFVIGYRQYVPMIDYGLLISVLLYLLIFIIAIKLSNSGMSIKEIFFNRQNLVMTGLTVVASYLGAALVSLFIPLSLVQSLAVSSGFGWYTLSGLLFTKMGDPLLGSVAFLCDLFREVFALLLIPTLSRIGSGNVAIGVAGATAMDVTLPIIEKHCGISYVPVALLSGGIITVMVPFLIPFFFSL